MKELADYMQAQTTAMFFLAGVMFLFIIVEVILHFRDRQETADFVTESLIAVGHREKPCLFDQERFEEHNKRHQEINEAVEAARDKPPVYTFGRGVGGQ